MNFQIELLRLKLAWIETNEWIFQALLANVVLKHGYIPWNRC